MARADFILEVNGTTDWDQSWVTWCEMVAFEMATQNYFPCLLGGVTFKMH